MTGRIDVVGRQPRGRIAVAGMMFEANTFAPGVTPLAAFQASTYTEGAGVLTAGGALDSISGAVRVATAAEYEVVPTTSAGALSGPTVAVGVYPALRERLLAGLAPHRGSVDGVYLQLHGAMVAEDEPDAEGDLIEAVTSLMGVPVAVSLDLHCHFTERMAAATPLAAGYHTLPHVDMVGTGERAMRLLLAELHGARPVLARRAVPMITSAEGQDTNRPPVSEILDRLHAMLAEPEVLDASLFMTQPWLDVPGLGWCAVVVTDGRPELARAYADELAAMAWERRERVLAPKVAIDDALARVSVTRPDPEEGPFVLGDGADSVSAGSPGDGVEVLAALARLEEGGGLPGRGQVIVTDADAARRCAEAGVGAKVTLQVGGSLAGEFYAPTALNGTVVTVTDGRYQSLYPPAPVDLGRAVVLRVGNRLHVVVTERPASQLDYQLYLRVGLDPRDAHVVVTKSAGGYRAFFEPLARECLDVDTRGPSDSCIERLPFRRVDRPLYPLDRDLVWPAG